MSRPKLARFSGEIVEDVGERAPPDLRYR